MIGRRLFSTPEARAKATRAVRALEARTSAEVVLVVRARAARHREAHWLAGGIAAFALLLLLLYLPQEFEILLFPVWLLGAFVAGALLAEAAPAVERRLVGRRRLQEAVGRAAHAAFHDLGISRTTRRDGILLYAAQRERCAELVADIGVASAATDPRWAAAAEALRDAVARADDDAFLAALARLGDLLAADFPRRAGDVDELPDVPDVA